MFEAALDPIGKSDVFDKAIARFSMSCADPAERDHSAFMDAIHDGRIEAQKWSTEPMGTP